jgi:hypothetical protein
MSVAIADFDSIMHNDFLIASRMMIRSGLLIPAPGASVICDRYQGVCEAGLGGAGVVIVSSMGADDRAAGGPRCAGPDAGSAMAGLNSVTKEPAAPTAYSVETAGVWVRRPAGRSNY